MDLIIREANVDDAAAILGLLNPIIESGATAFDAPLTEADERNCLAGYPPDVSGTRRVGAHVAA